MAKWTGSLVGWSAVALLVLTAGLAAQGRATSPAQVAGDGGSIAGRDTFEAFCASCHGKEGRGDGPVAPALKARPSDLTGLARANGGAYPAERVEGYVTGRDRLAAHGTPEMPIWGTAFRTLDSEPRVRERIRNVVAYVGSLQQPSSGPGDPGAVLFRTHCASCHGAGGRGDGLVAAHLRVSVPDLTRYTARNGGVFPSEKLSRIVDGRDIAAHGDREMPVWGDVFRRRTGDSQDAVDARIAAIMRYVAAIQQRGAE